MQFMLQETERRYDMENIGKIKRFILLCALFCCAALGGCGRDAQSYLAAEPQSDAYPIGETEETEAREDNPDEGNLLVYICGEVECPGVYELPAGSRICDALLAAGGMTDAAGKEYWNLAQPLCDGQMICFPTEEEAHKWQESGGPGAEVSTGIWADGRVNINTAALEELMTIPGVGQTRGEAIVAYRQEHGGFESPEDIMKVSGIGTTLYERMKDCIAVE